MSTRDQGIALITHGNAAAFEEFLLRTPKVPWDELLVEASILGKPAHLRVLLECRYFNKDFQRFVNQATFAAYLYNQEYIMQMLFKYGANNMNDILLASAKWDDFVTAKEMLEMGANNPIEAVSTAIIEKNFDYAISIINYLKDHQDSQDRQDE